MSSKKPVSIDFRQPRNKKELLAFLGIDGSLLDEAVDKTKIFDDSEGREEEILDGLKITTLRMPSFFKHYIPKKGKHRNGECRVVWQACHYLEDAYKTFARRFDLFLRLAEKRYPHPHAYGYIRGRSTIENATPHCGKSLILHADIKNFFPSISADRIYQKFIELGIHEEVAGILTRFVTIEDSLPLGLHPSPMLANLICLDLDDKIALLAERYKCAYTRYADDISISGHTGIPSKEEIEKLLKEEGFALSERKFRITKPGQAHYVTGLSVTDSEFPRAPRSMKRHLRQELYYCTKYGVVDHLARIDGFQDFIRRGVNRLDGTVRYVANIEEAAQPTLRQEWAALLKRDDLEPSYSSLENRDIRYIVFFIDESEVEYEGKKGLALSIVQTEDCNIIDVNTAKILREHLADPFAGGKKKELEKKKMHYVDANEDLRKKYIDYISMSPFKGYLAYGKLGSHGDYEGLYLRLLEGLLSDRLMGCDGNAVLMVFEENSKISSERLKQTVGGIYAALEKTNNRRPVSAPKVLIGKKDEYLSFAVPDFLLGVWGDYIKKQDTSGDRAKLHFERLRDKYRIILDTDRGIVFSRKRPFLPENWNNA
jgi:hypothetical protein